VKQRGVAATNNSCALTRGFVLQLSDFLDAVRAPVPLYFFLNFDIAFCSVKAQHLLALASKVETRRTQWLRNQVLVELYWRPSF
jgi:hypothetical protein